MMKSGFVKVVAGDDTPKSILRGMVEGEDFVSNVAHC